MPQRHVLVLARERSSWRGFLEEFFEDTSAHLFYCRDSASAGQYLQHKTPDIIFIEPEFFSIVLTQKFKVLRVSTPQSRFFQLGTASDKKNNFLFDHIFQKDLSAGDFRKQLVDFLPLPDQIRILVIDDEPGVGLAVKDFLQGREKPVFRIEYAGNGEQGLEVLEKKIPDVLILDIKMPVKDGREVYRTVIQRKIPVPVIIFFDAVFGDEITEIHKIGKPAIVEKGSFQSSMPELMLLIKKMVYCG